MAPNQPSCSHHHHHQEEENIWGAHLNDFTKIRIACIDAKFCLTLKSCSLRLSGNDFMNKLGVVKKYQIFKVSRLVVGLLFLLVLLSSCRCFPTSSPPCLRAAPFLSHNLPLELFIAPSVFEWCCPAAVLWLFLAKDGNDRREIGNYEKMKMMSCFVKLANYHNKVKHVQRLGEQYRTKGEQQIAGKQLRKTLNTNILQSSLISNRGQGEGGEGVEENCRRKETICQILWSINGQE